MLQFLKILFLIKTSQPHHNSRSRTENYKGWHCGNILANVYVTTIIFCSDKQRIIRGGMYRSQDADSIRFREKRIALLPLGKDVTCDDVLVLQNMSM